jgi:hypothetical protein
VRDLLGFKVINTRSVSQSFDGDSRASHLLIDNGQPIVRKVEYDSLVPAVVIEAAQEQISNDSTLWKFQGAGCNVCAVLVWRTGCFSSIHFSRLVVKRSSARGPVDRLRFDQNRGISNSRTMDFALISPKPLAAVANRSVWYRLRACSAQQRGGVPALSAFRERIDALQGACGRK